MSESRTAKAEDIAERAAERYFAALASRIPFDAAPGDVNLIEVVTEVEDALTAAGMSDDLHLHAGYILGVAIGRRLGMTRGQQRSGVVAFPSRPAASSSSNVLDDATSEN